MVPAGGGAVVDDVYPGWYEHLATSGGVQVNEVVALAQHGRVADQLSKPFEVDTGEPLHCRRPVRGYGDPG